MQVEADETEHLLRLIFWEVQARCHRRQPQSKETEILLVRA